MKTGNQQLIENLTNENEQLRAVITNLKSKIEGIENKNIFDDIKQKENLKYISDEVCIYIEKYLKGRGENEQNTNIQK